MDTTQHLATDWTGWIRRGTGWAINAGGAGLLLARQLG